MKCEICTQHLVQITCLVRALHVTQSSLLVPVPLMGKFIVGFSLLGKGGAFVCALQLDSELILIGEWHCEGRVIGYDWQEWVRIYFNDFVLV